MTKRTKCKCCTDWQQSIYDRRDFRQDHGGGPEVIPAKSIKKKKGCAKGGEHIWIEREGRMQWSDREKKMVESWYDKGWYCSKCNKRSWRGEHLPDRSGCPGNDHHAHVYVWIKYERGGPYGWTYYRKTCIGCGKEQRKSRFGGEPGDIYETRTW